MTSQPPSPTPQPSEQVPTCYRHPNKETWVRCQRCDRPICPDCMNDASVGFQCPECVAEGNRGVRQARSTFGGTVARTAVVTWTLLVLNVVAYGVETLAPGFVLPRFAMWSQGVYQGEWWRLITGTFLHSPLTLGGLALTHILFNMWALYAVGPALESRLGHLRFLALYLLSALGGSVAVYLFGISAVGASGAIFGLFGALFVVSRRLGYDARGVLWLIGINVVLTFVVAGISWQGHLGGLVTGTAVAAAFAYAPAKNRNAIQLAAAIGIFVVLALVLVVFPPLAGTSLTG